ncbi:hypothetical protein [Streptodolium elevatio]|uniref:Uncharacterized protein n=1 Tax=Streptodolium elevatio TaxID=3157996 RepID=A0ABV3D8R5_9ACTN
MSTASVLEKARALQNQARHIAEAQKDAAQQERVVRRIDEVRSALEKARGQLRTAVLLRERTGLSVNLASLAAAYERFENKSRGGLPADRVFAEAQKALDACAKEFASTIRDAWAEWARTCVSGVSSVRFAALAPPDRREAENSLRTLRVLAERKTVDGTTIRAFCADHANVLRLLEHAPSEVPTELAQLIERIDGGGLTLCDLSDDDIALLRTYDQDVWISVTRKAD